MPLHVSFSFFLKKKKLKESKMDSFTQFAKFFVFFSPLTLTTKAKTHKNYKYFGIRYEVSRHEI